MSSYGIGSEVSASWQAGLSEITSSWETLSVLQPESEQRISRQLACGFGRDDFQLGDRIRFARVSSFSFGSEQLSSLSLSSWSGLEFGLSSWNELVSESSLFSGIGAS